MKTRKDCKVSGILAPQMLCSIIGRDKLNAQQEELLQLY